MVIRMMRFLRDRGIDVEPEIHSLRDLQKSIYSRNALGSYERLVQEFYLSRESFTRPFAKMRLPEQK